MYFMNCYLLAGMYDATVGTSIVGLLATNKTLKHRFHAASLYKWFGENVAKSANQRQELIRYSQMYMDQWELYRHCYN